MYKNNHQWQTRVYMDIQHCWIARHCAIIFQHKYWILCTPLLLDSAVLNIYKCWNKKNPVKVLNIMYTIVIQHCWIVKNSAQLQKFSAVLNFMYTLVWFHNNLSFVLWSTLAKKTGIFIKPTCVAKRSHSGSPMSVYKGVSVPGVCASVLLLSYCYNNPPPFIVFPLTPHIV